MTHLKLYLFSFTIEGLAGKNFQENEIRAEFLLQGALSTIEKGPLM